VIETIDGDYGRLVQERDKLKGAIEQVLKHWEVGYREVDGVNECGWCGKAAYSSEAHLPDCAWDGLRIALLTE
jgi:hypothetical protein